MLIIENFNDSGYIIGTNGVEEIENALNKAHEFNPQKYTSNNGEFVRKLEECIYNFK